MLAFGGVSSPPEENDPIVERVHAIIPTINFEIENYFDSTAVLKKNLSIFCSKVCKSCISFTNALIFWEVLSIILLLGETKKEDTKPQKNRKPLY